MAKKETKTNAMRILDTLNIKYEIRTYECDDFIDGIDIANKLSLPYAHVFKTLVTVGKSKEHYVFVIPVDKEIDLSKCVVKTFLLDGLDQIRPYIPAQDIVR